MAGQVINASEVQNAGVVPLEGVTNAFRYADQVALARKKYDQDRSDTKKDEDFRKAEMLRKAFDGLDIGTGTPWDEVGRAQVQAARDKMVGYMRANPGASYTDMWGQANDATRDIAGGISEAKKVQGMIDKEVDRANKEYPHIDPSVLKAYYQNKAFRDANGNTLTAPNYNFYGDELSTPAGRARFANPVAVAQGVSKELSEGFKPEAYAYTDASVPGAILRGEKRAYQLPNGDVASEPVSWQAAVPQSGVMSPASLYQQWLPKDGTQQLPSSLEPRQLPGVPDTMLARLKSKPIFSDALELEKSRIRKEHGDYIKGMGDDSLERVAAYNLVHNYGDRSGLKMPEPDYKVADHETKLAHQNVQEAIAAKNLQLHAESVGIRAAGLSMRQEKAVKQKAAQAETVPNMLALSRSNPAMPPKGYDPKAWAASVKHAQNIEQNNREFMNIGGYNRAIPVTNLSKWHGVQLFEPGTKNPVVLKLANLGGKTGEVLYQIPVKREPSTGRWMEDAANLKMFGAGISNGKNSVKKPVADVLQEYDRQWNKGIKYDNEDELEGAFNPGAGSTPAADEE